MGQSTTTFNIDELITSYIDNQISDPELKSQIEAMLSKDEKLMRKYKSELLTKQMLSSKLPVIDVPEKTYRNVISSIDGIIEQVKSRSAAEKVEYPTFWQTIKHTFKAPFLGIPRYAFGIVAVFILGIFLIFGGGGKKTKNPYILAGTEKSIMVQAVNSFHKILSGDVKPELSSSNAAEVEKYVHDKAHFEAFVPKIDNYQLTGVVCNEYNGQNLAHLIYKDGHDEIIYIYQTPLTSVQKKNLDLPDEVANEITKMKYYMCDEVDDNNCTMTLWYKGNIICVSMSTMPKKDMYAAFSSFNK